MNTIAMANILILNNETFEFLLSHGLKPSLEMTKLMARQNELEKLKMCHKFGIKISGKCYKHASMRGNFELLNWLYENNIYYERHDRVFSCAPTKDKLEVVKILDKYGLLYEHIDLISKHFVSIELFEGLEYLESIGYPISSNLIKFAAMEGNLNFLIWANSQKIMIPSDAFGYAAEKRQFLVMRWMQKNYSSCNSHLAWKIASKKGLLDVMQFLYNHGYATQTYISMYSILYNCGRGGHCECLTWLESVYDIKIMGIPELVGAAESGQFKVLKWYKEKQGYLKQHEIDLIISNTNKRWRMRIIKWLSDEGVTLSNKL
jgi:hypothetical protein